MTAPAFNIAPAAQASLAERILAGDLSDCPEYYSDEEWRREAQCALDGDDRDLLWMLADCERRDRHADWQRSARNPREAMCRDMMSVEDGPFGELPLSAFCDGGSGRKHPLMPSRECVS